MAVSLYKNGRWETFNEYSFTDQLKDGWSLTEEDAIKTEPSENEDATEGDIIAAIQLLDPENTEHWTATGLPMVPAIETIMGKPIVAKQRNDAWKKMKAE